MIEEHKLQEKLQLYMLKVGGIMGEIKVTRSYGGEGTFPMEGTT